MPVISAEAGKLGSNGCAKRVDAIANIRSTGDEIIATERTIVNLQEQALDSSCWNSFEESFLLYINLKRRPSSYLPSEHTSLYIAIASKLMNTITSMVEAGGDVTSLPDQLFFLSSELANVKKEIMSLKATSLHDAQEARNHCELVEQQTEQIKFNNRALAASNAAQKQTEKMIEQLRVEHDSDQNALRANSDRIV